MSDTSKFKIRVGVILPDSGGLLLARQNRRPFWVFPGGTLEEGEDMETCAIREIQEETGLTVEIERLLYVMDFMEAGRQALDVFFLARLLSGALTMMTEENLDDLAFHSFTDAGLLDVRPTAVIQQVLRDWETNFQQGPSNPYLGRHPILPGR